MHAQSGCHVTIRSTAHDAADNFVDAGERPLEFTVGRNEVIAGIEQVVIGRRAGHRFEFVCPPEDAYGPYRSELVFEAARENLPPGLELVPGMSLQSGGGPFTLTVLELTAGGVRLDGNHPLAGKMLRFSIEILDVSDAPR